MRKLKTIIRIMIGLCISSIALVVLLRWVPVDYTPIMLKRSMQSGDYHPKQKWVSLEDISPDLIAAVIAAEDQQFYRHHGFDWMALGQAWTAHRQEGKRLRGCSTISQQTAKNVFTFGTPTLLRKAVESYWCVLIELFWDKRRILEVYLNIAEMGRGLYGAQAAAQYYFGIPARRLDLKQSASIAVCLPCPLSSTPDCLNGTEREKIRRIIESIP